MALVKRTYYASWLDTFINSYEQPVIATLQLFKLLHLKVPDRAVNEYILSHPDYPGLLSISDCLREWKVENVALRTEKENIEQYPLPMMVHTTNGFRVITNISEAHIDFLDETGKTISLEKQSFFKKWDGVALLVQADTTKRTGVSRNGAMLIPFLMALVIALATVATILYIPANSMVQSIAYGSLLLLKLSGILICVLLLWYQIDRNNRALQRICGKEVNARVSCLAILESSQAYLFRGLSWSEMGLFYFTGSFMLLLLFPQQLFILPWLNIIALPYTVYSIAYQRFVIKKWCPLCLAVQGILVAEFITGLATGLLQPISASALVGIPLFQFIISFALPVMTWYFIKPFVTTYQKSKRQGYELARLKRDPRIFNAVLTEQKEQPALPENLGILLGNPDAKHSIVKVSNPYCAPCSKAHRELTELLKSTDMNVRIIFTATNDPGDIKSAPVKHLLAIAAEGDPRKIRQAVDDWYLSDKKDYGMFAEKYKMNGEINRQDKKIERMDNWCRTAGIAATPTIFVNGFQLPEQYALQDLKYIFNE